MGAPPGPKTNTKTLVRSLRVLEQGIIQNCKVFYRQYWLRFVLQAIEEGTDPQSSFNIRLAIRWILRSWSNEVTNTTIHNCFRKLTLISEPIALPTTVLPTGLSELFNEVVRAGDIRDSMAIDNYLYPIEEEEEGNSMLDEAMILQEMIGKYLGVNQDEEEEVVQDEQPLRTAKEAEMALKELTEYTESQDSLHSSYLRVLERLETAIGSIKEASKVQSSIDSWIT
ncbi:centromere binding protein Cbh2/jerky [Blumeria hordei DH14]|uniref:Centromere binding protein Cbh2/jerky n=1 Tax=Blumeria graminis f. sp. hordei (strain DH14) TaxID=546991 RepID=N1JKE1_BLUG1|nr:centromere binding protein Cbh2/jerky [Blumeria hordei DH14]